MLIWAWNRWQAFVFGLNGFQVNFEHNPSRDSNMGLKLYYIRLKQCFGNEYRWSNYVRCRIETTIRLAQKGLGEVNDCPTFNQNVHYKVLSSVGTNFKTHVVPLILLLYELVKAWEGYNVENYCFYTRAEKLAHLILFFQFLSPKVLNVSRDLNVEDGVYLKRGV